MVGADQTEAPEEPWRWVPIEFFVVGLGGSGMVWVCHFRAPVLASTAARLPRKVQHSYLGLLPTTSFERGDGDVEGAFVERGRTGEGGGGMGVHFALPEGLAGGGIEGVEVGFGVTGVDGGIGGDDTGADGGGDFVGPVGAAGVGVDGEDCAGGGADVEAAVQHGGLAAGLGSFA